MPVSISRLEELIAIRAQERSEDQKKYTREMTEKIDASLGARLVDALDPSHESGWEMNNTSAIRRFIFKNSEFHLVVNSILGTNRVEVELRHQDMRFTPLAKKAAIHEIDEDWFLNSIEMLSSQVRDRLKSPKNFI